MYVLFKCLLISCAFLMVHGRIGCKGENGRDVDMFIIYKLPKQTGKVPHLDVGLAYAYMDSHGQKFKFGDRAIDDRNGPLASTLNQVYNSKQSNSYLNNSNVDSSNSLAHIFYNDDSPEDSRSYSSFGHTKGALAFDKHSGFWLIHSVPRFPAKFSSGFEYPDSGKIYAQCMICITFASKTFREIGEQLIYNHPHIHSEYYPHLFRKDSHYESITALIDRQRFKKRHGGKDETFHRHIKIPSLGGVNYDHFAKHTLFDHDIYHNIVAKELRTNLLVETWRRASPIGSTCSGFTVKDVELIKIKLSSLSVTFTYKKDHSKFAISEKGSVVCIGDINREKSQYKRAGGTMCIQNAAIWQQFHKFIAKYDRC